MEITFLARSCYFEVIDLVNGSSMCPPKYLTLNTSQLATTPNPEYLKWIKVDQLLMIWIHATISKTLLPYVIS